MDDYVQNLLAYVDPQRIHKWSCGHIIPKENLIALPVAKGPSGMEFNFTYKNRESPQTMELLGNCLLRLSKCIPDGLIVFFPSYSYLDQVISYWRTKPSQTSTCIWDRLVEHKPVFQESKTTTDIGTILTEYSLSISSKKGGLLLSVIGGKLSEGINFSDELGRGIVVVGLPFPNLHSAQWRAKLEYIERTITKSTGNQSKAKAASREYYENACMRAVNQSIGRAIRHKGDFASIILLDSRYTIWRIEEKLPGWIRQRIEKVGDDFSSITRMLTKFFDGKKEI